MSRNRVRKSQSASSLLATLSVVITSSAAIAWIRMRRSDPSTTVPSSISRVTNRIARISRSSEELKLISLTRSRISIELCGSSSLRIGLSCTIKTSRRCSSSCSQREDRRVPRIAAVPVGLMVDLDGLKEERQARGGEHRIDADLGIVEHLDLSGADVRCGQVQFDRAGRRVQRREIDAVQQHLPQRILVERVELVRREQSRHQIEEDEARRLRHRVITE